MFKKPLWQTVCTQIRLLLGAVCSGSTLFASILNLSVMLGNYLQQTTSADDNFSCIFSLGALRVNVHQNAGRQKIMHVNACYYLITRNSQYETAYLGQPWRKAYTSQMLECGFQKLLYFIAKTCVVGSQKNSLKEMILLSTLLSTQITCLDL